MDLKVLADSIDDLLMQDNIFKVSCRKCGGWYYQHCSPDTLNDELLDVLRQRYAVHPYRFYEQRMRWWSDSDRALLKDKLRLISTSLCDKCCERYYRDMGDAGYDPDDPYPDATPERLGTCELCDGYGILVNHHWYEPPCTYPHWAKVCHRCNNVLCTPKGEDNHVLPAIEEQRNIVRKYITERI